MKDQPFVDRNRIAQLVSELTDGGLSSELAEELRQLVATDEAAAKWYCEWMMVHSQLHLEFAMGNLEPPMSRLAPNVLAESALPNRTVSAPRRWGGRPAAIATIGGVLAASLLWLFMYQSAKERSADSQLQAALTKLATQPNSDEARREFERLDQRPLAVLSRIAVTSGVSASQLVQGAALKPGRFAIETGAAQIEFVSGAILVVEGPADLELLSSTRVFCRRGKLRARVPTQAHGFTIETPTHRAIDLGTEFAVDVSADHSTEVHVLDGEVELKGKDGIADKVDRTLKLGDGFRGRPDGKGSDIKAEPDRFIGAQRLLELSTRDDESRYEAWRHYGKELAADKDVITYFNFEDHTPWQRILRQDGPRLKDASEGAIVGCRWTEGRWSHKSALEFKGTENRVRIFIPGEYDSITLACWVRIEGFDRWLSALMLTDGHDLGEVHWQFTETGQLLLGVKADMTWSQDYLSPVVLRPTDVGRWVHLATVYDQQSGSVAHYVDGHRVSTEAIRKDSKLRFGAAELGNWVPEIYKDYRVRSLNGRIDEFVVFKTALTEQQIYKMYEVGQPNS